MTDKKFEISCPTSLPHHDHILMAHGGGGRLMHQLLDRIILPPISNPQLEASHDASIIEIGSTRLAFTTDSFVVAPLFFPGGDIGKLAVCGTVNDLAMAGARPLYLSLALIIEEGFPVETLQRVMESIRATAKDCSVEIITGDTKVVERGKGDGLFINTAGIGLVEHRFTIRPSSVVPGDAIILSGDIGRHGIAIMAQRDNLGLETEVCSDCASLHREVLALLKAGVEIHCLRDLTRGGLASALVEIAQSAGVKIDIDERRIPVCEPVRAACEILGFDPLHVANEGRFIVIVPEDSADVVLGELKRCSPESVPEIIGQVGESSGALVRMSSAIGGMRVVDMLSGEQLPRIC